MSSERAQPRRSGRSGRSVGSWLAPLAALVVPLHVVLGEAHAYSWLWLGLLGMTYWLEGRVLAATVPEVSRTLAPRLVLGESNAVQITLRSAAGQAQGLRIAVRDDIPPTFLPDQAELSTVLAPHARVRCDYAVVPKQRGRHAFGDVHIRVRGRLRLCDLMVVVPAAADVSVYPNARATRRYALAAHLGSLRSLGIFAHRRPGTGGEFEQLREYVAGDAYRDVDWKATAKRLRPVLRVYGEERSQTVMVAIDVGRMMATSLEELTKLDHALQAALLLTHVALRAGDRVGLILFADDVRTFLPPMRGPAQYRRVLDAVYDAQASATYVDFRRLSEFVLRRVTRRSLLVIFSDLLDESQAGPICQEIGRLRRKHLPVCVAIEDPVPKQVGEQSPWTEQDAYLRAAAADLLAEREAIRVRLHRAGVGLVEVSAGELAFASVNRYLDIKQRRAL